jgi:hypothetical protein
MPGKTEVRSHARQNRGHESRQAIQRYIVTPGKTEVLSYARHIKEPSILEAVSHFAALTLSNPQY